MSTDVGRQAAYADLVAAVLDLRSPATRDAFDEAVIGAQQTGAITEELARQLRWLQRQNERAMVEHAESVLPPALVALDRSAADVAPTLATILSAPPQATPDTAAGKGPTADPSDDSTLDEPPAVVNLQARRLLVAGLRPIAHAHHRGSGATAPPLPSVPPVPADPGL